jgi:glucuronoarabinoxylan endo-1,4-beta-xylanase
MTEPHTTEKHLKFMKSFVAKENPGSPAALTLSMGVKKNGLKNKWLSTQAALAIGFVLQAGLAAAQTNLVTNPGFETGDTSGWTIQGPCTLSVETSQVHSGTYACLVTNRTQTYSGIAQSLLGKLQSGQSYNVLAWVQLASGGGQTIQVTVVKTDGSGTSYVQPAVGYATTNGWTQLSGQYTYNPSGSVSALAFYVELPNSSNAPYYIDDVSVTLASVTPTNGQCTVDWTNVAQRIDGFGASSAWDGSWTTNQANMFFGTNNGTCSSLDGKTNFAFTGIGLSLLRNHIYPAGSTSSNDASWTTETSIMQMAQALGALVWSAPWTPAVGFKSTHDIYDSGTATGGGTNGGSFLGGAATNQAYASQLANYVANMTNYGVNLYAISVQNEPDADVTTYEACQWTNTYIHDFVTNLYNALVAKGVGSTKIILPESQNWPDPKGLAITALSDSSVAADVGIVADHNYVPNNVAGDQAIPAQLYPWSGKSTWETEVSQIGGSYDGSITNAVYWAGRVHLYMTAAQVNAWHYWWLIPLPSNTDNEALTDTNGIPAKRMYALGQFARFVRPGYYRIGIDTNSGSALVSAYKNPNSSNFAIVAINSSSTVVTQAFNFTNITGISSVTPWITSASMSLSNQTPVAVSSSSFSYALPALSVVTFVGQAVANSNIPPTLAAVADQTINAGQTLLVTNAATDPNVPPQTLTFTLLNNPSGATLTSLNTTNALFTWRAPVSQANTTNLVTVAVTDNGTSLSATNSFHVIVNPLSSQPTVSSIATSGGQVTLVVAGPQGPDYSVLTSTNLTAPRSTWQVLSTTNSPVTPVTLTLSITADPVRFYSIQIGP